MDTPVTPPIPPYIPEQLSRWDWRLMQMVSTRQISLPLELGFGRGRLCLDFTPGKSGYAGQKPDLVFTWGDRRAGLFLGEEKGLYTLMGGYNDQSPVYGVDPGSLPRTVFLGLAEAVLEPVRAFLSTALDEPVEMADPDEAARPAGPGDSGVGTAYRALDVRFEPEAAGEPVIALLVVPCDEMFFGMLESLLIGFPARHIPGEILGEIGVEAAFCAGETVLPAGMVKGMEKGDVLIPDTWFLSRNQGMLMIPPFSCRFSLSAGEGEDGNRIVLLEKGVRRVDTAVENAKETIEDLEIKVSFEIERRMMPVREIRTLVENSVIPLGVLSEQGVRVDIVAGGKCIARGRVVSLGETLGIQVVESGSGPASGLVEEQEPDREPGPDREAQDGHG